MIGSDVWMEPFRAAVESMNICTYICCSLNITTEIPGMSPAYETLTTGITGVLVRLEL